MTFCADASAGKVTVPAFGRNMAHEPEARDETVMVCDNKKR